MGGILSNKWTLSSWTWCVGSRTHGQCNDLCDFDKSLWLLTGSQLLQNSNCFAVLPLQWSVHPGPEESWWTSNRGTGSIRAQAITLDLCVLNALVRWESNHQRPSTSTFMRLKEYSVDILMPDTRGFSNVLWSTCLDPQCIRAVLMAKEGLHSIRQMGLMLWLIAMH